MNGVQQKAGAMAKAWAAGLHYFRERPALTIAVAISAPVAMALFNIMLIYGTAMPGYPPRDWARTLVLMPPIVAVVLLQALPFGSIGRRVTLSMAFGLLMIASLFAIHLFGACSYGDCF